MSRLFVAAVWLPLKHATWCRVFHRWHRTPVYGSLKRTVCEACSNDE